MHGELEFWVKIVYTLMVALILPVYFVHYGPINFLWFSDIALVGTAVALWLESPLLASTMAVAVLLPELLWNLSFFARLVAGVHVSDLAAYMFDPKLPRFLRALSLFHVVLPIVLLWMLRELGYDSRAWLIQILLAWVVLPTTYALKPKENINWVYGLGEQPQRWMHPRLYLALLMVLFPALHLLAHAPGARGAVRLTLRTARARRLSGRPADRRGTPPRLPRTRAGGGSSADDRSPRA